MVTTLVSLIGIVLALVAAALWAASASVLPANSGNFAQLYEAIKKSARLNRWAAICTFASTTAQAIVLYMLLYIPAPA